MHKMIFLSTVTEVMKGMVSQNTMMASFERCGMRSAEDNTKLLSEHESRIDELVSGLTCIDQITASDTDLMDALILRYLNNMQFLSDVKEERIDITGLSDEFGFWKKTILFKTPKNYKPKKKKTQRTSHAEPQRPQRKTGKKE